ncbi:MAG: hypothetical protein ACSI46_13965 [Gloeotrichia echinulata DVL01]|nr:hypothetical protein [Gloeotrichia echinulata DEX184]
MKPNKPAQMLGFVPQPNLHNLAEIVDDVIFLDDIQYNIAKYQKLSVA